MTYYELLGVRATATSAEIKRAYRQLVVRYHPDKNPDPRAVEVFRSITEAYDVLSDPNKRGGYDHLLNPPQNLTEINRPPAHRDPAYRRRNPHAQSPKMARNREPSQRQLMKRYLPYAQKMSVICLAVCLFMAFDYLLPSRTTSERIVQVRIFQTKSYKWFKVDTEAGETFALDRSSTAMYVGDTIKIDKSLFFGIPVRAGTDDKMFRLGSGIYGNFIFIPILTMVVSSLGIAARKDVDFGFNLGVGSGILLLFIFVLILIF